MERTRVGLNLWLLGALPVVGIPSVTVAVQFLVRRVAPEPVVRDFG